MAPIKLQYLYISSIAFMVLAISGSIAGSFIHYTSIPVLDAWSNVIFYARIQAGDYAAWWEHHNEHLIALGRLLAWLDFKWFNGAAYLLLASNYVFMCITAAMIYSYLIQLIPENQNQEVRNLIAGLAITWIFSWVQRDNIIWSFQGPFFLATLLPLAAFYLLSKAKKNATCYFGAGILGILAIGSLANGILLLPLLVVMAVFIGIDYWRVMGLILLTGLGVYIFFYDFSYTHVKGSLLNTLIHQSLPMLKYIVVYLGSPVYFFTGAKYIYSAVIAGVGVLCLFVLFVISALRTKQQDAVVLALLFFIIYVLITAVVTAGGRVVYGIMQALTSRYTTPVLHAWAALLVLSAPYIVKFAQNNLRSVYCMGLLLLLMQFPMQFSALHKDTQMFFNFQLSMLAVALNVQDQEVIANILPAPEPIMVLAEDEYIQNAAFFNSAQSAEVKSWMGQLDNTIAKQPCQGSLDALIEIPYDNRFLKVNGWMGTYSTQQIPTLIRILNLHRKIIGFALVGGVREGQSSILGNELVYSGFQGYINNKEIETEVILKGLNSECEIKVNLTNVVRKQQSFQVKPIDSHSSGVCAAIDPECASVERSNLIMQSKNAGIIDSETELEWEIYDTGLLKNICQGDQLKKYSYQDAKERLKQLNEKYTNKWRLPKKSELEFFLRKKCQFLNNDLMFNQSTLFQFWSDSLANNYAYYAWDVLFTKGYESWRSKFYERSLILVRSIE